MANETALQRQVDQIGREMLNLRGPASERTVHQWARYLLMPETDPAFDPGDDAQDRDEA